MRCRIDFNALTQFGMEQDHSGKGIVWLPLIEVSECQSAEGQCSALHKHLHRTLLPQSCLNFSSIILSQFMKKNKAKRTSLKLSQLWEELQFICGIGEESIKPIKWVPENCFQMH